MKIEMKLGRLAGLGFANEMLTCHCFQRFDIGGLLDKAVDWLYKGRRFKPYI